MSTILSFHKNHRKLVLTTAAIAAILTAGILTTDGRSNLYCDAFSTEQKFQGKNVDTGLSRSSIDKGIASRKFGGVFFQSGLQPRMNAITAKMASSDENMQTATPTKMEGEHDTTARIEPATTIEENLGDGTKEESSDDFPFDMLAWKTYEPLMEDILMQRRAIKNADPDTIAKCRAFLLNSKSFLAPLLDVSDIVRSNPGRKREALELALTEQSELFRQRFDFTEEEYQFINRCLVYMGDACAKEQSKQNRITNRDGNDDNIDPRFPIYVVWRKIKEMGLLIREKSLSSYMYILSSTAKHAIGTDENGPANTNDDFIEDTLLEVVSWHDTIYAPSEKTLTIRLKGLVARGKIDEAEEMFAASFNGSDNATSATESQETTESDGNENIQGRLRTYMPLMEHYCKVGDLKSTLRLYRQMQKCVGVHFDVESYTILLSSLARFGYFFDGKPQPASHGHNASDDDDDDDQDRNLYGPKLFDSLVSDMANDILELTEATANELAEAFRTGIKEHLGDTLITEEKVESGPSAKSVILDRVELPKGNGTCPITGVKLRLLALDETQRQHVHDTLLEMSKKNTEEFLASNIKWQESIKETNPGRPDNIQTMTSKMEESYGYQELRKFSEWLDDRKGNLFTTIVDGANVAYYGHSNVHYSSLKKVVETLESMGERPLVIMPEKYTAKKFYVRPRYYQKLSEKDLQVIDWLREKEIIYVVPRFVLDDYFWMLASVSNQTNAAQHGDLTIPIGDDQGRFPGMRPLLITNDQMRDHKLDLLEPREFRRWCSCHIVNYDIGEYDEDEWEDDREISLSPADSFSREMQPNMHPNGNGNVWHFPIGDSSEWLCISIEV